MSKTPQQELDRVHAMVRELVIAIGNLRKWLQQPKEKYDE